MNYIGADPTCFFGCSDPELTEWNRFVYGVAIVVVVCDCLSKPQLVARDIR